MGAKDFAPGYLVGSAFDALCGRKSWQMLEIQARQSFRAYNCAVTPKNCSECDECIQIARTPIKSVL